MKIYNTLKTDKAVWAILREMKLNEINLGDIMMGIKDGILNIPFSLILDKIHQENKLELLLSTITRSETYIDADGKSIAWDECERDEYIRILTAFFTPMLPMLIELMQFSMAQIVKQTAAE